MSTPQLLKWIAIGCIITIIFFLLIISIDLTLTESKTEPASIYLLMREHTMNIEYDFNEQLQKGAIGEEAIKKHILRRKNVSFVEDVSKNSAFFKKGIDMIIHYQDYSKKTIDIKTDTYYASGNFAIEFYSNVERQTIGCFWTTQADMWYYYFPDIDTVYVIDILKARELVKQVYMDYRSVRTPNRINGVVKYNSECRLIPIELFVKSGIAIKQTLTN